MDMKLDFKLQTKGFRMDQPERNPIEYDVWGKGMEGLWIWAPDVEVEAFEIDFLYATNLLMPGQHVIDFNKEVGVRIPYDLLLVGDVAKKV